MQIFFLVVIVVVVVARFYSLALVACLRTLDLHSHWKSLIVIRFVVAVVLVVIAINRVDRVVRDEVGLRFEPFP